MPSLSLEGFHAGVQGLIVIFFHLCPDQHRPQRSLPLRPLLRLHSRSAISSTIHEWSVNRSSRRLTRSSFVDACPDVLRSSPPRCTYKLPSHSQNEPERQPSHTPPRTTMPRHVWRPVQSVRRRLALRERGHHQDRDRAQT